MGIPTLQGYSLPKLSELPQNKTGWKIEASKTALLIHDMQDYFLSFWPKNSSLISQLIANIVKIKAICQQNKIPIYYSAQPVEQSHKDRALLNDLWGAGLTQYPELHQIVSELSPSAENVVLTKWRYSAFERTELASQLKDQGRDQLIICGVYAHIGCMATALDAFMKDIKPFIVADAIADFNYDSHLMALNYTSECCGQVESTENIVKTLSITNPILSKERLRSQIISLLDEEGQNVQDDENLLDYGLDSVRIMSLITRWRQEGIQTDFISLMKTPTINGWAQLFS